MAEIFQVGSKIIQADEIPSLLSRYQLLPQFLQGIIIDEAIALYSCTDAERKLAIEQFAAQHQLTSPEARKAWAASQGMTLEQLEELAVRPMLLEKFKIATWSSKVESYFLARKANLDQVVCSLIRTKDVGIAQEVYFRIQEGEQSFADLAREYSQGTEAHTGGVIGPVTLSALHPAIAKMLSISPPGQLWTPTRLEEWYAIVRLEKFLPAQLDEQMRRRLIDEMFNNWLKERMQQVGLLQFIGSSASNSA